MEVARTYINHVATAVIIYFTMSILSEFNTYFDILVETVVGRSFVKLKFMSSCAQYVLPGNVDNAVSNTMQVDGIKVLIAT